MSNQALVLDSAVQPASISTFSHSERVGYLMQHGIHPMAFSTMQPDMEYFDVPGIGYIAYARYWGMQFVLSDPVCDPKHFEMMLERFVQRFPDAAFAQVSKVVVDLLHGKYGYYGTQFGSEAKIPLCDWNLRGSKKQIIRTAVNQAKAQGVEVKEGPFDRQTRKISESWIKTRKCKSNEIRFLIRPMQMDYKEGTRLPTVVWAYPIEFGDADTAGQVSGSTNRFTTISGYSQLFFALQGYAVLDFNLPRDLIAEDGTLEIKAARGQFKQEAKIELDDDHLRMSRIILTTDKPIYQPGQLLHIRALALDFSNRAIAGTELELEIEDPEGTTQFRADLKTSRFGVANIDWPIPDNTRLGDYRVTIEMDDDKHGEAHGENTVKISRYELPNFAVKTKPNRDYYLPGQNAEVEIRADYLFGQPVNKGRVRIVREKERRWNYREQKWEAEETENYEGELDGGGRFSTRIDLTAAHKEFADENYKRFEDLSYAAYVTDATTGRTEQKRFDLRVTREPIHIYVIGLDYNQSDALPLQFYLSASYADGTPAQCEIAIGQLLNQNDKSETEEPLRKIKTNRHGVAKVSGLQFRQDKAEDRELKLAFTARDGKGGSGHFSENVRLRDQGMIRVETDKAIYRPGEPLEIRLTASEPNTSAVLNLTRDFQILHSQFVQLRNGKATVTLPYRREFKDALTISAAGSDEDGSCCGRSVNQSRSVIYPRDRELKLKLYSRIGVDEYWIADWRARTVEVYRRTEGELRHVTTLSGDEVLTSPLLPGFALPLGDLWVPYRDE